MPRIYGVPDWWNDRYHALLDQFVEHMGREFADVKRPTNREAFDAGYMEYEGMDPNDQWWNIPIEQIHLDFKAEREITGYHLFSLTGRGFQYLLPVYMRAV